MKNWEWLAIILFVVAAVIAVMDFLEYQETPIGTIDETSITSQ